MLNRRAALRRIAGALGLTAIGRAFGLELGGQELQAPVRLVKYTARVEMTEEVARKIRPSREAFISWAEQELPRMGAELQREKNRMERAFLDDLEDELEPYVDPRLEALDRMMAEEGLEPVLTSALERAL